MVCRTTRHATVRVVPMERERDPSRSANAASKMEKRTAAAAAPRSWTHTALGIAAVASFLLYAWWHWDAVALIWSQVRVPTLALLSLPAFAVLWTQGKVFQRCCREFGVRIDEAQSLSLAVLTTAGNYVGALRLGAVTKALYMKRARNLSLTDSIAIVMGGALVGAITAIVGGVLLLAFLPAGRTSTGRVMVALLTGACVLLLATLTAPTGTVAKVVERYAPALARDRVLHLLEAWRIVRR